jgi:membrane protease YdiL (CAAX protease family)
MVKNPLCILILSVLGPVTEEICFRYGVMGSLLESARWRRWAIPVSALLFGVIHMNPPQIIAAFVLGLFLGWLYLRTRSLWLPIICHVVNNTNSTVIALLFGVESSNADLFPTPWAMAVATVVSIGLTLWLLGRLRRVLPVAGE